MIKLELTTDELTHIRVAMLGRLTTLTQSIKDATAKGQNTEALQRSYDACMALMCDGGKLWQAMRVSQGKAPFGP